MKKFIIAVVALILTVGATAQNNSEMKESKKLVAYFSCTGVTKRAAEQLAAIVGADLYEIAPEQLYTDADLDWRDKTSRSTVEMKDPKSRPQIATAVDNMARYDVVYVGFPIWWDLAPTIVNTFIESYDLKGKTIVAFATSGGSTIAHSDKMLQQSYPDLKWQKGKLLNGTVNKKVVDEWLGNTK